MKEQVWAMYYMTVLGWQYHPRANTPLTTEQCATVADQMLEQHIKRWGEQLWPSGQPRQTPPCNS